VLIARVAAAAAADEDVVIVLPLLPLLLILICLTVYDTDVVHSVSYRVLDRWDQSCHVPMVSLLMDGIYLSKLLRQL
jgi:hypothetical protein